MAWLTKAFSDLAADERGVLQGDNHLVFGTIFAGLAGASWLGTELGLTYEQFMRDLLEDAVRRIR
jgi:hypothetical protein